MYRVFLFLLSYCCLLLPIPTFAEPGCDDCIHSLAPRLWIPDGDPTTDQLPLKASHADIRINGPIAQVIVTQHYSNAGKRAINARYVFPGSTHAAVHGLTMKIGERVVEAKIKEKNEAKQTFNMAKQQGKHAALLDQERPNIFMMDVANIMPGDDIELVLKYSELLIPEQGVYEFVYPTVVGPRYGSDPFEVAQDAVWIANPYAANNKDGANPAATQIMIKATLESPIAVKDLQSVQHKIETQWRNEKSADIALNAAETQAGNRDFILRFRLQDNQIVSGLMTYTQDNENYFLMMAQPPARVQSEHILPREYLFVLDVSGSMHGFPLDTAKRLMQDLLNGLKPQESFNILFFSGGSSLLSPEPLAATPENLQKAQSLMLSYEGGGGTELVAALQTAYAMPRKTDIARSIVIVTDGYINAERDAYDLIHKNLNSTNLFAFGIGSSVNRFLIEAMAKAGAGEPFVVTDPGQVNEVGNRFRRFIEAPLLTDIQLRGNKVELYDLEPQEIPLMLAERPVVIFGKYHNQSEDGSLELTGKAATGNYQVSLPLTKAETDNRAELLPVLWARNRLTRISDMAGNDIELNRDEILKLGLHYSLLTQYTSFVAVDDVVVNKDGTAKNVQQPLPLPQGVSTFALGSTPMPEPEFYWLMIILAILFILNTTFKRAGHVQH